jgi:hypothetical protein
MTEQYLTTYRMEVMPIVSHIHITERRFCVKLVGNVVPIKPRSILLHGRSDQEAL